MQTEELNILTGTQYSPCENRLKPTLVNMYIERQELRPFPVFKLQIDLQKKLELYRDGTETDPKNPDPLLSYTIQYLKIKIDNTKQAKPVVPLDILAMIKLWRRNVIVAAFPAPRPVATQIFITNWGVFYCDIDESTQMIISEIYAAQYGALELAYDDTKLYKLKYVLSPDDLQGEGNLDTQPLPNLEAQDLNKLSCALHPHHEQILLCDAEKKVWLVYLEKDESKGLVERCICRRFGYRSPDAYLDSDGIQNVSQFQANKPKYDATIKSDLSLTTTIDHVVFYETTMVLIDNQNSTMYFSGSVKNPGDAAPHKDASYLATSGTALSVATMFCDYKISNALPFGKIILLFTNVGILRGHWGDGYKIIADSSLTVDISDKKGSTVFAFTDLAFFISDHNKLLSINSQKALKTITPELLPRDMLYKQMTYKDGEDVERSFNVLEPYNINYLQILGTPFLVINYLLFNLNNATFSNYCFDITTKSSRYLDTSTAREAVPATKTDAAIPAYPGTERVYSQKSPRRITAVTNDSKVFAAESRVYVVPQTYDEQIKEQEDLETDLVLSTLFVTEDKMIRESACIVALEVFAKEAYYGAASEKSVLKVFAFPDLDYEKLRTPRGLLSMRDIIENVDPYVQQAFVSETKQYLGDIVYYKIPMKIFCKRIAFALKFDLQSTKQRYIIQSVRMNIE